MARRTNAEDGIRKIQKMAGKSLGVTIPVDIIKALGWKEKQKVVVKKIRGGVAIKDWKK